MTVADLLHGLEAVALGAVIGLVIAAAILLKRLGRRF